MKQYRATMAGYTDRRVKPGDLVAWDGEGDPPIQGLVEVTEREPEPEEVAPVRTGRRGRRAEPEGDVI